HDLYVRYLESDGKEAHFNSSALIYAVANALQTRADRDHNAPLAEYAKDLKGALIATVGDYVVTPDLRGKTNAPEREQSVDMQGFLDAIEARLDAQRA
ncbi:MAG: 3-isopropylmalate dehydrogenase, partial [Pseudomonadota bacterium]